MVFAVKEPEQLGIPMRTAFAIEVAAYAVPSALTVFATALIAGRILFVRKRHIEMLGKSLMRLLYWYPHWASLRYRNVRFIQSLYDYCCNAGRILCFGVCMVSCCCNFNTLQQPQPYFAGNK